MTIQPVPPATSYEVALAGRLGPAYRVALAAAGAQRPSTTSDFLLPRSSGADICEVVAMLQARGLKVLHVRRVPEGLPQQCAAGLSAEVDSSAVGDAPGEPHEGP
jgi:hypothetical protein